LFLTVNLPCEQGKLIYFETATNVPFEQNAKNKFYQNARKLIADIIDAADTDFDKKYRASATD